ncbi:glycoside hydrolase family 16 protein [Stipitochalara longipes BDJ]|nr:glycoside hydrolase family 16 protein [Stipitochalara longipes BDJ]
MVSSLFLRSAPVVRLAVLSFLGLSKGVVALTIEQYELQATYSGITFFDNFNFITGDPNGDFVNYVDYSTALDDGLISVDGSGTAYIMPDSTTVLNPNGVGRESVKLVSKDSWTHGLVITDLNNMPGGVCGVAAKHYLAGTTLANGEIDIITGVNNAAYDEVTLFSQPTCSVAGDGQIGTSQSTDCSASTGCSVLYDSDPNSFGENFNNNGGGVFATEWTSDYIRVWFFDSGTTPSDILAGTPEPALWGEPVANFQGSCDIDNSFSQDSIVFDLDFCTTLVEANWAADGCNSLAATCREYVASFPDNLQQYNDFEGVYWGINSVKVYQLPAVSSSSSSTSVPSTSSTYLAASSTSVSSAAASSSIYSVSSSSAAASSSVYTSSSAAASSSVYSASSSSAAASSSVYSASPSSSVSSAVTSSTSSAAPSSTASPLAPYTYYGCVEELTYVRILYDSHTTYPGMTLESCKVDCAGYTYFGTEYGDECYCGNSFNGPVVIAPDADCWMSCADDESESCGGPLRLSVYSLPVSGVSSSSSSVAPSSSAAASSSVYSAASSSSTYDPASSSTSSYGSSSSVDPAAASSTYSYSSSSSTDSASSSSVYSYGSSSSSIDDPASSSTSSSVYSTPTADPASSSSSSSSLVSSSVSSSSTTDDPPSSVPATTTTSGSLTASSSYPYFMLPSTSSLPPFITQSPSSSSLPTPTSSPVYITSTVYKTSIYTITSCAATVTDCPARIGSLTTETISLYTTVCPVEEAETAAATPPANPVKSYYTTVVVTTYTSICPTGPTTITATTTITFALGNTAAKSPPAALTTGTVAYTPPGNTVILQLTTPGVKTLLSTMYVQPVASTPVPSSIAGGIQYPAGNSSSLALGAKGTVTAVGTGVGGGIKAPTATPYPTGQASGGVTREWSFGAAVVALVGALLLV